MSWFPNKRTNPNSVHTHKPKNWHKSRLTMPNPERERLTNVIKSYRPDWVRKTEKYMGSWWTLESNEKSANANLAVLLLQNGFKAELEIAISKGTRTDVLVNKRYAIEAKEALYDLMSYDRLLGQLNNMYPYRHRYWIIALVYGEVRPDLEERLKKETQTPFQLIKLWNGSPQ